MVYVVWMHDGRHQLRNRLIAVGVCGAGPTLPFGTEGSRIIGLLFSDSATRQ